MKGAQIGSITIEALRKGVKLIDMEFEKNSSPEETAGAIVVAGMQTSTEVYDSVFTENVGTALQNFGRMLVMNSKFNNNTATGDFLSNDVEKQGGGVGGAAINSEGGMMFFSGCSFKGNNAEKKAPAVWSHDGSGIDGGNNCGLVNRITTTRNDVCDGIYFKSTQMCQPFAGGSCPSV
eukprot:CAMPEP_0183311028 /NCGR_PEP_ID=MMETSP0160_2-20130417/34735_1 /TAXON_ID=2839 ORGANISM="Odontella Sinensis, Strain Grunow 1884" /NCGR_SAMPLE_ID=MMETSP0160_2 /ASSEMBLY_ACC=CAM_ASM_000250 /LENGTH=177 /DNA_ID=CAMNT_0025475485 /DNA_START=350 /DNA_END=883 /DNA_ORIENTATION=+